MASSTKVGSTWKSINGIRVKVGSTWKTATAAYVKVNGVWKQWAVTMPDVSGNSGTSATSTLTAHPHIEHSTVIFFIELSPYLIALPLVGSST